jgi:signal transduction histidine kinase
LLAAWFAVGGAVLASGLALRASRQLSERRARFVSAVTHELRTPLTTFRLYTDMLSSKMVPDEQKRQEYISTLTSEADRLGLLVENVLSYSRLEEGRAKREPAPVNVGELLDRASVRAKERAESCGAQLAVSVADDVRAATAIADEAAVEQIVFNLVDNACKHALTDDADQKPIELDARRAARRLIVRVRDHGPGVDSSMRGRLFEPFSRGEGVTAPGSGLGLALSRELARASGGELTYAAPRGGGGAAFELRLPLGADGA